MRFLVQSLLAAICATSVQAQQMHAVAVSPDGSTVLAAGDNRTLYTIDADTLQVTERTYVPQMVREIIYTPNGRNVFLRMDKEMVRVISARSAKRLYEVEDIRAMSLAANANRIALLDDHYKGGILQLIEASSGKVLSRLEFPEIKTKMVGLSADGMTAMILTQGEKTDDEPKKSPGSELKGHDKAVFRQQNDGYISKIITVNFADDSHTMSETFFRSSFPFQVRMVGDKLAVLNNASDSALIASDGSTEMINFGDKYMNNARISNGDDAIVLVNNTEFSSQKLDGANASAENWKIAGERLDGPGEWVTAMAEGEDGTMYFVTNAYRIWKVAPGSTEPEVNIVQ